MTDSNRSLTASEGAAGDPQPSPTTTVTHYQEVGAQLMTALDAFTAAIPTFENAHELTADFVRRKRNIPEPFISMAVDSLVASPDLQSVKQLNSGDSHDNSQFIDGLTPVFLRLGTVYKGLKFTLEGKKAQRAATAQQIYAVAKGLAQDRNGATVAAHVDNMRRALKSARPRRAKAKTPAEKAQAVAEKAQAAADKAWAAAAQFLKGGATTTPPAGAATP